MEPTYSSHDNDCGLTCSRSENAAVSLERTFEPDIFVVYASIISGNFQLFLQTKLRERV